MAIDFAAGTLQTANTIIPPETVADSFGMWLNSDDVITNQYVADRGTNNLNSLIIGYQDNNVNVFEGSYPCSGVAANTQMSITVSTWTFVAYSGTGSTSVKGYVQETAPVSCSGDITRATNTGYVFGGIAGAYYDGRLGMFFWCAGEEVPALHMAALGRGVNPFCLGMTNVGVITLQDAIANTMIYRYSNSTTRGGFSTAGTAPTLHASNPPVEHIENYL